MKIKVQYFGMIAEAAGTSNEELELTNNAMVSSFIQVIQNKYPALKNMDFKIALNQSIVDDSTEIKEDAELAVLPPFAGG